MKFIIKRTSDWEYKEEKEINTLEELAEFRDINGGWLVFYKNFNDDNIIEIYDDYRE